MEHDHIVLSLSGRIECSVLPELQGLLLISESRNGKVVLDLMDVRLVDQQAVTFFAGCEANGVTVRNCPDYIREWIAREQARDCR